MTGGADGLGVAGTAPLDLVNENKWAVFTTPQDDRHDGRDDHAVG